MSAKDGGTYLTCINRITPKSETEAKKQDDESKAQKYMIDGIEGAESMGGKPTQADIQT
jgi:hypothetical protein